MTESAVRTVPCPSCRKPALFSEQNRWRPFCSERCRSADLGAWASERFRVPAESPPDDELPNPDSSASAT
jgi:endogenous inhibitor of DNA gyrase (YacG/DUF329 family)